MIFNVMSYNSVRCDLHSSSESVYLLSTLHLLWWLRNVFVCLLCAYQSSLKSGRIKRQVLICTRDVSRIKTQKNFLLLCYWRQISLVQVKNVISQRIQCASVFSILRKGFMTYLQDVTWLLNSGSTQVRDRHTLSLCILLYIFWV